MKVIGNRFYGIIALAVLVCLLGGVQGLPA